MFTGIVEQTGCVRQMRRITAGFEIWIDCPQIIEGIALSDSVAVDGVCQTVTRRDQHGFAIQAVAETVEKTTLGSLRPGRSVNLERSLRPGDRIGGHFVQGHIQGTGTVVALTARGEGYLFAVQIPEQLRRYVVREGSIAVDGVSLTIAAITAEGFSINLIPYSAGATTLSSRRVGDAVNIEVDIIGRYVERLLQGYVSGTADTSAVGPAGGLTAERLMQWGYQ